jgi:hypothetical protein
MSNKEVNGCGGAMVDIDKNYCHLEKMILDHLP